MGVEKGTFLPRGRARPRVRREFLRAVGWWPTLSWNGVSSKLGRAVVSCQEAVLACW